MVTAGKNGKQRADRREREKKEVVGGERERKNESEKERKRGKKEKEVERKEIGGAGGRLGRKKGGKLDKSKKHGRWEGGWMRVENRESGRER